MKNGQKTVLCLKNKDILVYRPVIERLKLLTLLVKTGRDCEEFELAKHQKQEEQQLEQT